MSSETSQLKTLKDLPIEAGVYSEDKIDQIEPDLKVCFRWKNLLRQEAINHIKEKINTIKGLNYELQTNIYPIEISRGDMQSLIFRKECEIGWIKHFFNISDEELK